MTVQGVLHPLNHCLKYLLAISALKGIGAFHFCQLVEAGAGAVRNWKNIFGH